MSEMTIKVGDVVKVIKPGHRHFARTGVVQFIGPDTKRIDSARMLVELDKRTPLDVEYYAALEPNDIEVDTKVIQ